MCFGSPKINDINGHWLYIPNNYVVNSTISDYGKWLFIFPMIQLKEMWFIAKDIYYSQNDDLRLIGLKCLNYDLHTELQEGVIMFFLNESSNRELIMQKGISLLLSLKYTHAPYVVYKMNNFTGRRTYIMKNTFCKTEFYEDICCKCTRNLTDDDDKLRHLCFQCKSQRTILLDKIIDNEYEYEKNDEKNDDKNDDKK